MLKITFLGTGTSQGVPIIGSSHPVCLSLDEKDKRLRVSVLIQWKDCNIVIDCGPDFRQQMLYSKLKKLDASYSRDIHKDLTRSVDKVVGGDHKDVSEFVVER
jgi:phosphoribosyl 1,2-cyclic phosphate phosphodiesterase